MPFNLEIKCDMHVLSKLADVTADSNAYMRFVIDDHYEAC